MEEFDLLSSFGGNRFHYKKRYTAADHRRYCELHNIKYIDPHAITAGRRTPADVEATRIYKEYVASQIEAASKAKAEEEGGGLKRPLLAAASDSALDNPNPPPAAAAGGTNAEAGAGCLLKRPCGNSSEPSAASSCNY